MSIQMLKYVIYGIVGLIAAVGIAYFVLIPFYKNPFLYLIFYINFNN